MLTHYQQPHLLAVHRQPLLERELEPVAHGHAVARLVVEELVGDGACRSGSRLI